MPEEPVTGMTEVNKYGETVEVGRYDRFRHSNGAYYAFVHLQGLSKLDTPIPEGVKWSKREDGTQKTLNEFVGGIIQLDDDRSFIMPLCAIERPTIRQHKVNKDDLDEWIYFMKAVWDVEPELLTSEEMSELLANELV